jgi:PadR family transcriptional regulator, regulatory protein PadR
MSFTAVAVLKAIADGSRHGFDIMDAAGLRSGTVYPLLGRLEEAGYVRSRWEAPEAAQKARRPARRYYDITAAGRRALEASLDHFRTIGGRVPLTARPSKARP